MANLERANIRTSEFTGAKTLPKTLNRTYFMITVTTGSIEVEFGQGGGTIPLNVGTFYEPLVTPTSQIDITGTGTYTIAEA